MLAIDLNFCVTLTFFPVQISVNCYWFSKSIHQLAEGACFQFRRTQLQCENFDPGTADAQQQQDVFLNAKYVYQAATNPGNNNTHYIHSSLKLIYFRHNSYQLGLDQSVSTQFDINKAWSEASKKPKYKSVAKEQQQASLSISQSLQTQCHPLAMKMFQKSY